MGGVLRPRWRLGVALVAGVLLVGGAILLRTKLRSPVGKWQVLADASIRRVDSVPEAMRHRFRSVDEYRQWLRPTLERMEFEFRPDGTMRYGRPGSWWTRSWTDAKWRRNGLGSYWLEHGILLSASIGHKFDVCWDGSAVCMFQVDYEEDGTPPRCPIVLKRVGN